MSVERRRGCGFRKVGALYLVADGAGLPCCLLPHELTVCPTCGAGIKQSRGWTWVNGAELFGDRRCSSVSTRSAIFGSCPLAPPRAELERAGLLWVGKAFYRTPGSFNAEAERLGISKRIAAVPRGFELGKTWVLLAHPEAVYRDAEWRPGVFRVFRPQRIEKLLTASQAEPAELEKLKAAGITPVVVPDDDTDHQGSVWDDEQRELELDDAAIDKLGRGLQS